MRQFVAAWRDYTPARLTRLAAATPPGHTRAVKHRGGDGSEAAITRLRAICAALPDAVERSSHGSPAWFAGRASRSRAFATLDDHHHGAEHLSVWLPQEPGAQVALVELDPARFFRPPYVGTRGWVGVVLDGDPDWDVVARLVRDAYVHVASPKLRAALAAEGAVAAGGRSPRRR